MPKIKTHKATAKRFVITKKKIKRRKAGQNHFNSRERGNTTRNKRRDIAADSTTIKTIKSLLPYRK